MNPINKKPIPRSPDSQNTGRTVLDSGLALTRIHLRPGLSSDHVAPADIPGQVGSDGVRRRLSGPDPRVDELILPFRKHWPNRSWQDEWSLYWLPASFSNGRQSRADPRFLNLFEALIAFVDQESKLRHFTFFDSQLIHPHLTEHFVLHAMDYLPLGAIGYHPGSEAPRFPRYDDVTQMDASAAYQKMLNKQQDFRIQDVFPNTPKSLQFIVGDHDLARRELMGRGGYSFALTRHNHADFSTAAKHILAQATQDPILLEMPIVIPLFTSRSFTAAPIEQLNVWFQLLDLYVGESSQDEGILIVSNRCLDEELIRLVESTGLRPKAEKRFWRR